MNLNKIRDSRFYWSLLSLTFSLLFLTLSPPGYTCGPDFPNNLLDQGDQAILAAPVANFYEQLARINLVPSRFQALPPEPEESHADQNSRAEENDLAAALKKAKIPQDKANRIRAAHSTARQMVHDYVISLDKWQNSREWITDDDGGHYGDHQGPKPPPPALKLPEDMPKEFALYLDGALTWRRCADGLKTAAREPWEQVLALPEAERHWKSTWAAFMLGKSWETEDPKKSTTYFRQVRDLAKRGFADSIGLAAASLGLEARVALKECRFDKSIDLYLEQLQTGDSFAASSLRITAEKALSSGLSKLSALATNQNAQQVITAYLISAQTFSYGSRTFFVEGNADGERFSVAGHVELAETSTSAIVNWLNALESVGVENAALVEQLAVAAYRSGDMEVARRWLKRAHRSSVTDWLQAKLLLRSGKIDKAAALLAQAVHSLPALPSDDTDTEPELIHTLFIDENESGNFPVSLREGESTRSSSASRRILGELGVLHLARREYTQALDALLRAGFWGDAAYVAERVLTIDELKSYVDANWYPVPPEQIDQEKTAYRIAQGTDQQVTTSPVLLRSDIRYLLARRLTRNIRGDEARPYYPAQYLAQFDALCNALRLGWDESASTNQRAEALFEAAKIARHDGMELLGTELAPDWHIHGGSFEAGVTWETRAGAATNADGSSVLLAARDELRRASEHHADPEQRFHYRYQAAFLAWEAVKNMPNNNDRTALMLCTAGSWLKARDPQTADIFYKALVRRNRNTRLGDEADLRRWFPDIDENGNIIEPPAPPLAPETAGGLSDPEPTTALEMVAADERDPLSVDPQFSATDEQTVVADASSSGTAEEDFRNRYTIERGDTLIALTRKAAEAGLHITVEDIVAANPGIEPTRLRIGQQILLPSLATN